MSELPIVKTIYKFKNTSTNTNMDLCNTHKTHAQFANAKSKLEENKEITLFGCAITEVWSKLEIEIASLGHPLVCCELQNNEWVQTKAT